ncbi:BsuPI-related putative proteinase inhibitor [Ammoniphilus sp. YIM 78166]|uniref:BsuPI-related putative proteinase inhibitor n=1 Tax=Ammoniphilus sp. YIM 78166 TaxID=1644106 RepID=UPI001070210D|nr:BsuPI-related putative proteinase inhibitor [Ammoniphilus sp. YIM 78166]
MKKLWIWMTIACLTFLMGCAGGGEVPTGAKAPTPSIVEGLMEPFIVIEGNQTKRIHVTFGVKNQTEKDVELTFPSGQRYDYVVKNEEGTVVKHYSIDKLFIQAIQTITIKPGDELKYEEVFEDLEPGTYSFEFWITAQDTDLRDQATFIVQE